MHSISCYQTCNSSACVLELRNDHLISNVRWWKKSWMVLFIKSVLLHKFKKVPLKVQTQKLPEFCPLCIFHLILFYFDGFCFYDPILYFISKFSRDVNFLIVKLIEMHNAVSAPKLLNNNSFHSLLHWIYIGHLLFLMIQ